MTISPCTFHKCSRLAVICLAGLVLLLGRVQPAVALSSTVTPNKVDIKLFYHGAKLAVSGQSNAGDDLIIKITSPPGESHLKFKGKAAGLFWMKLGSMTFEPVPSVYMLFSTKKLDQLLDKDQQSRYRLGYKALAEQAEVKAEKIKVDKDRWFDEFVKFKKKDNLYMMREGVVTRRHGPEANEYRLDLDWPFQASPGVYTVKVLAVRDGRVVEESESNLTVARAGLVAKISSLAFDNAALYGIMAVLIALIAGIAVGVVFKGGGGH